MEDRNVEFRFLYKKCKKIKPGTINSIFYIKEFVEAIKEADKFSPAWCDETVYHVLKKKCNEMVKEGSDSRAARHTMRQISKDVTGDSESWRQQTV